MNISNKNNRSLIICTTPLQVLISSKIIDINNKNHFDIIYLSSINDSKNRFYYEKISEKADKNLFYNISSLNKLDRYQKIYDLKNKIKNHFNNKYEIVYIASIHDKYCQIALSNIFYNQLNTYDDGIANINYEGLFYNSNKESLKVVFLWFILGRRVSIDSIKATSRKHYSIYESRKNIIDNTFYLNMFNFKAPEVKKEKQTIFFLGQPLYEIDIAYDNLFINSVLKKIRPDFYFPHPRETLYSIDRFQVIQSEKIFEDYLIDYIIENPNTKIIIYSFFSSVLLNIDAKSISLNAICSNELYCRFTNVYNIFEDSGISVINLEYDK